MRLLTGTSGYAYPQWRGSFYPADLDDDALLAHYASKLPAVEINNTFYRMPKTAVVASWAAKVPASFTFVLKASQAISHKGKLGADAIDSMQWLWKVSAPLGVQLGAVLIQLPAWVAADVGRLREFLASAVPRDRRVAFELAHPSWQTDEVEALIVDHGGAIVIADRADGSVRWPAIGTWAYVRLRRDAYDAAALAGWRDRLAAANVETAYVFFKHEETVAGADLALAFAALAR